MDESGTTSMQILVVEDEPGDLGLIQIHLRQAGYEAEGKAGSLIPARNLAEAKKLAEIYPPDLVLLDLNLPDSSGLGTLVAMRQLLPAVPIIVMTGNSDVSLAVTALQKGAQDYLVKGQYEHGTLGKAIRQALERKEAEEKLARSEANMRALLDNVPYLIWLKDTDCRFIAVNEAFFRTTGRASVEEVLGKTDFDLWPEELAQKYRADDMEVMERRIQKLTEEQSMDNGETLWMETFKAPILDRNGKLLGTTGFARDITERKLAHELVQHMAHYDTLTDLPNRVLFTDRLQHALTVAKRDKSRLALMFIDLDKFKPVNDELGHHVGDLLLKEAAKRMQHCVRESDTVARIGGDEFVVVLPVIEEQQDAVLVAEKIRHALNQPFNLAGQDLHISSSTGISIYPEHGGNETQLVRNADTAMYHAKEGGRNSVVIYNTDMQDEKQ